MEGRACIRGLRVTMGMIIGQIGAGRTIENVLEDFPYLEREDVQKEKSFWQRDEGSVGYEPVTSLAN